MKGGSVLILVLWTLFMLSALAVAAAIHVEAAIRVAAALKQREIAMQSASAGVEQVIAMSRGDTNGWDGPAEAWRREATDLQDVQAGESGRFSITHVVPGAAGWRTVTNAGVVDEEARININRADAQVLQALASRAGNLAPAAARDFAAAVCDWRDANDDPLTGGAESDYYQSLATPYRCRNADFGSEYELRLVKGVDAALMGRLAPYVTVFGSGKINLNAASPLVLLCIADAAGGQQGGVSEALVARIAQYREGGKCFSEPSMAAVMSELSGRSALKPEEQAVLSGMAAWLTLRSTCFRGVASGRAEGGSARVDVEFVYDREKSSILSWYEH